jgi:alpha-amylase
LWVKEHKPEFIHLLNELHSRGQIEFIGGAMYEPVLSLIPEDDGVAQIRQHLGYIEELFSTTPKGIWLAERVYEPYIPRVLSKAGILYTILDDNHFKAIGMNEHELYRY